MAESDQKTPATQAGRPVHHPALVRYDRRCRGGRRLSSCPAMCSGGASRRRATPSTSAIVGIGGMGGSNARALMSQNIVAICDVDDKLVAGRLESYKTALNPPSACGRRGGGAAPRSRRSGPPRRRGEPATAGAGRHERPAEIRRAAAGKAQRYATTARCSTSRRTSTRRRRHARSPARRHRAGRDGPRQARLRAEAADAGRSHEARQLAQKAEEHAGRHADGQPGPLVGRGAARRTSTSGPARSARCAKSTSGRTVRSATGRRAFRGRRRSPDGRPTAAGTGTASRRGSPRRWAATIRSRRGCVGSVPRRCAATSSITRSITRSTGAAGSTGAGRARRHGRAPDRSSVLGADLGYPTSDRDGLDAVQRRLVPERHDDLLRVPGARRQAGGEADLVRRRPAAAASRTSSARTS